ncbi:glycosyltransferase involved in cell wall biosynthesis [Winogradskyella pacifica]|uniref:Glycosyltransferase involved in cell wall biosynthesis n=1 Tax=Winogradskyella pacifica TaxID=664642 RepID=A0A3D9N6F2_9FLAO|nr:glycosyltransferase [Winogradskyella pacifica]REE25793.1 glycosyltransferase involved in cell wall biosynthesis [Winogradskyella pacifica]
MKSKITTYFILPTLFAGGAERVISFVSQNLNKDKFNVKLIIIGFEKDSKFDISGIPVIYLNKDRVLNAVIPIIRLLKKEKPDIVISSISHLNSMMGLVSLFFRNIKFIGRHATINKVAKNYRTPKKRSFLSLFDKVYTYGTKSLDRIICQSSDMKNDFLESYNYNPNHIQIIHNPITKVDLLKTKSETNNIRKFITVGRLSKIKGQLRLLDILAQLTFPFQYTIIGEGTYKSKVFTKIDELGLKDSFAYIPYTDDVFLHLINHDMFLQGSYSEGFPNALLESCSVGVPVIAFNSPGGTKEIVSNGINGYLVNNEDEFLEKLYEDKDWDPKSIREFVYEKFNKEKIIKQYETLFFDILTQN